MAEHGKAGPRSTAGRTGSTGRAAGVPADKPAKKPGAGKVTAAARRSTGGSHAHAATGTTRPAATTATTARRRSEAEIERIRAALLERYAELRREYEQHMAEIAELQRDRLTDSAGDDQVDTGSKTYEREQEISLANSILERVTQVERALERVEEGGYGWCERCGNAIPVERLAAFPSATLCVSCKQLEERR